MFMHGWIYACMHACMHAWIDGCMHACMDRWIDGWMDVHANTYGEAGFRE